MFALQALLNQFRLPDLMRSPRRGKIFRRPWWTSWEGSLWLSRASRSKRKLRNQGLLQWRISQATRETLTSRSPRPRPNRVWNTIKKLKGNNSTKLPIKCSFKKENSLFIRRKLAKPELRGRNYSSLGSRRTIRTWASAKIRKTRLPRSTLLTLKILLMSLLDSWCSNTKD